MRIFGELTAEFTVDKEFKIQELIHGCDMMNGYVGHEIINVRTNINWIEHLESEVTLKHKDKTVVINMKRKDNKIYLVKIRVYGENITSDYLNSIVMITKTSFGLDEVIK